jgi:hypothetical protein
MERGPQQVADSGETALEGARGPQMPTRLCPVLQTAVPCDMPLSDTVAAALAVLHAWGRSKVPGLFAGELSHENRLLTQPKAHLTMRKGLDGAMGFRLEQQETRWRWWQTDVAVGTANGQTWLVVRNAAKMDGGPHIEAIAPKFVSALVANLRMRDAARRVDGRAWEVESLNDLDQFLDYLENAERLLPLLALSRGAHGYFADIHSLSRAVCGQAHVVGLSKEMGLELKQELGKELAVFNGGARLYGPGFGANADSYAHPLVLPQTGLGVSLKGRAKLSTPAQFERAVVERVFREGVVSPRVTEKAEQVLSALLLA